MSTTAGKPAPPPDVLQEVQGDIWPGLGKSHEIFYLFSITKPDDFKIKMKNNMVDKKIITSAEGAFEKRKQNKDPNKPAPEAGINVSFSPMGMDKLGWSDDKLERGNTLNDRFFKTGLKLDALDQGRDDDRDYEEWMKKHISGEQVVDGLFTVCGNEKTVKDGVKKIESELGDSIQRIHHLEGNARPGKTRATSSEFRNLVVQHADSSLICTFSFGFKDTISQPRLDGWEEEDEKSLDYKCRPGVIVMNHPGTNGWDVGDPRKHNWEPEWAKNGSYFVFRKMEQDVGKFKARAQEIAEDGELGLNLNPAAVEARFVGRWHSGAPLEWHPTEDPATSTDGPKWDYGNKWEYKDPQNELNCPFASHIRKSNPRNTFHQKPKDKDKSLIMRRGIPYGSDYSEETKDEPRGLLFGCYQSNIQNGYSCLINKWMNTDGFPCDNSGQDVIVAQPIKGAVKESDKTLHVNIFGLDENHKPYTLDEHNNPPNDKKRRLDFPSFIKIRGGEYFFTPSIPFLANLHKH